MNPDSPAEIRALLQERGLALKKRWGQNFLVNRGARERLVSLLEIGPGSTVWEIGPGLGSMTELLARKAGRVVAFEVDRGLCRLIEAAFGSRPSFVLVPGDFLETWRETAETRGLPDRIFGNLPYRSASLMIADLIKGGLRPALAVVTVQRELAERLCSRPGTKSYSSFSVLCQAAFRVASRGDLQPGSFYPAPEVVSSIVELRPRDDCPEGRTMEVLSALARGLFSSRRKMIRGNLAALRPLFGASPELLRDALAAEGIDPGRRAEEYPPEAFVALAKRLTGSGAP